MQIQTPAIPMAAMVAQMYGKAGMAAFYRGFLPNMIKNAPNKSRQAGSRAHTCCIHYLLFYLFISYICPAKKPV